MDATRPRRTRDAHRRRWYAAWRAQRFARLLGFGPATRGDRVTEWWTVVDARRRVSLVRPGH